MEAYLNSFLTFAKVGRLSVIGTEVVLPMGKEVLQLLSIKMR
jgi:hypothetical protein